MGNSRKTDTKQEKTDRQKDRQVYYRTNGYDKTNGYMYIDKQNKGNDKKKDRQLERQNKE